MITEKITYYTTPDVIYDNEVDVVKGTSLTGKEVDKNFNTLEGRSIKDITIAEDGKTLNVNLLNGKVIKCENMYGEAIFKIDFNYNAQEGKLCVWINNDESTKQIISGFLTEGQVDKMIEASYVFTDSSLYGNGTVKNPLMLSRMEKTGVYKPVMGQIDILPETSVVGRRYVTTGTVDKNGSLYNYDGVIHIMTSLEHEESKWHVASKADWDDMLNAMEPNPEDRNHTSIETPEWLGEYAGAYLAKDEYGFNVTYCGYAMEEEQKHLTWANRREQWWTSTNERGRSAFTKRVDNPNGSSEEETNSAVYQDIIDPNQFFSVRLVRDMEPNETMGAETIMEKTYNVTAMPSLSKGLRLWINVNFNSVLKDIEETVEVREETTDQCTGETIVVTREEVINVIKGNDLTNRYRPTEWSESTVYYVCEYDGSKWIKKEINNYDTFYVKDEGDFYYLLNGQLKPVHEKVINLENKVAHLERILNEVVNQAILDKAFKYHYDDYIYVGSFSRNGNKITYDMASAAIDENVLYDFARFFGALYRVDGVNPIKYSNVEYVWNEELGLKGSNYTSDGTLEGTLMKKLTNDFQTTHQTTFNFTMNNIEHNVELV